MIGCISEDVREIKIDGSRNQAYTDYDRANEM